MASFAELKERVLALPFKPGVYIMKNKEGTVIYVGKAKALKNRVSSYFQNSANMTEKTRRMVSNIYEFDIIITKTEFEALVLENSMIKKYKPKYNILLKDGKGYPYIKVNISDEFPVFSIVSKPTKDKSKYLGPYTGRQTAFRAIDTVNHTLGLKSCGRVFPRDIGKQRACLNFHLGKCVAPCTGDVSSEQYKQLVDQAVCILEGKHKIIAKQIETEMLKASEELLFERAAYLRDKLKAINSLTERKQVVAGGFSQLDIIAFTQGHTRGCIVVLHYIDGELQDKEYQIIDGVSLEDAGEVLGEFAKQYYTLRQAVPKTVLLSAKIEDSQAVEEFLSKISDRKVEIIVPQKGKRHDMINLAIANATEEIARIETIGERNAKSLEMLGDMIGMEKPPSRIEAYDISNFGGEGTVGSMIVFEQAQPKKSAYRKFKIESVAHGQDDYAAMREMITRRIDRYLQKDEKFSVLPDLFFIDGGVGHVRIAQQVLDDAGITTPCFGMVKDDKHRTRALVNKNHEEFSIVTNTAVFALVGKMQEEVHRFAITYNRKLTGKGVKKSILDEISGVGEKRRTKLLKHFKSIENIKNATEEQLASVVPKNTAKIIFEHFHKE